MNDLLELYGLAPVQLPPQERTVQNFNLDAFRSTLEGMDEKERKMYINNVLRNLEIMGSYQTMGDKYTNGYNYGGRVGYNFPIDENEAIRAGLFGGGSKMTTPQGTFKNFEVTGGDVGYQFGPNDLSLTYTAKGAIPTQTMQQQMFERNPFDPTANARVKDFWQLLYRRQF